MTLPLPDLAPVVTIPRQPTRCRRCRRLVIKGVLVDGYGEDCARIVGVLRPGIRLPVVSSEAADDLTLFDLINEDADGHTS